jgi:hypothetical protein
LVRLTAFTAYVFALARFSQALVLGRRVDPRQVIQRLNVVRIELQRRLARVEGILFPAVGEIEISQRRVDFPIFRIGFFA